MFDWLNIGVRFALYVNLMLVFGLPIFTLYSLTASERRSGSVLSLRKWLIALTVLALFCSLLSMAAVCAAMAGMPVMDLDRETVEMVITQTPIGTAWLVRMAALMLVLIAAITLRRIEVPLVVGGGVALASLAWTGHGAAGEGAAGTVLLAADIAHLLAAGVWVGALAAFAVILTRDHRGMTADSIATLHRVLARFSIVGTIIVGVIVGTGLVNSLNLVGLANLPKLASSLYGQLLMAKLALFGLMLALAAVNRFRLTPALVGAAPGMAIGKLRKSLMFETGLALAILALVALLGTLSPPMSAM